MINEEYEVEVYDSWTKVKGKKGLIARKKIDKSFIKQGGSGIPKGLYREFPTIDKIDDNHTEVPIKLRYEENLYNGNILRKKSGRVWINIKDEEIRNKLSEIFKHSVQYIQKHEPDIETTKKFVIVPDELAEYAEFYHTNQESVYEMRFITSNVEGDHELDTKEIKYFEDMNLEIVQRYIKTKGYSYSYEVLANFYLSLKSKPFTILAGVSGIGKSKLVRLFAEAIGARFELIPVKPDWSDATDLLGYRDLNQTFHKGRFIEIIEKAMNNLSQPYIICLDEMNLARVEYYFSDFLSLIESRRWQQNEIITDCFRGEDLKTFYIPENVYIVGTVNMDEATFQLSKKILDRANTIELSEMDLAYDFEEEKEQAVQSINLHNNALRGKYLVLKECSHEKEAVGKVIDKLIEINEYLKPCGLQFAYRIRDEIVFYMLYNKELEIMEDEKAFDYQVLQKILPRINGTSPRIRKLILSLCFYCLGEKISLENQAYKIEQLEERASQAYYPHSYRKLVEMLRRLDEDGFTSFWL